MHITRRFLIIPVLVAGETETKANEAAVRVLDAFKRGGMPRALYGQGWHAETQGKFASMQVNSLQGGQYAHSDQRLT